MRLRRRASNLPFPRPGAIDRPAVRPRWRLIVTQLYQVRAGLAASCYIPAAKDNPIESRQIGNGHES